jgi:hypothetical protein
MLEKTIERKVCDYAKLKGFLAYKFTSPQRRSVPDRLFISPKGKVFFIEFKAPKKYPTDGQYREIRRLRENGAEVYIVDDVDKGMEIIDEIIG